MSGEPRRPHTFLPRFAAAVVRRRVWVLATALAVTAVLASQIGSLRTDNSVRAWFDANNSALARYDTFVELFGSDEYVVLAFDVPDAFNADSLATIDRLTRALQKLDHVEHVSSLTNVEDIGTDGSGLLQLGKLIEKLPAPAEEVERARGAAQKYLMRRTLVSDAGDVTAVAVRLAPLLDEDVRHASVRQIRTTAERVLHRSPYMMGVAVGDEETFRLSEEDFGTLLPLMVAVISALLWLIYRSVAATLLPLVVVALSTLCALGALALAGRTMNVLITTMPLILLILGIWSAVYVLSSYRRLLATGVARNDALEQTLVEIGTPCVIVNLTTAIGFASFATSQLPPVRDFGVFTAIGLLACCILSLTALPAALAMIPPLPAGATRTGQITTFIVRCITVTVLRFRVAILCVALVAFLAGAIGLTRLRVNENWLTYVPRDSPFPRAVNFIEKHLTPTGTLETVVVGQPGSMQDPAVLNRLDAYAAVLRELPSVERTTTLADFLKTANQALKQGKPEDYRLPETRQAIAQYLLLLTAPDSDVSHYVDNTFSSTRVTANIRLGSSTEFRTLIARAEEYLQQHFNDFTIQLTGIMELNYRIGQYVISTQIFSLAVAVPAIVATMTLLFRSARLVPFIAMVTVFPVIVTLGFMGFAGIPLNSGTVLVASIALGLVGDNAVYLLCEMRRSREKSFADVVARGLEVVGPPALYSFALTCSGFAMLGLAQFRPTAQLGLLTALSLGLALFADIVLMPAVIMLLPRLVSEAGPADEHTGLLGGTHDAQYTETHGS